MTSLAYQRRLASSLFGSGEARVWFDAEHLAEIKEAITREDIKRLIGQGLIRLKQEQGISRGRHRVALAQKRKGRGSSSGSRKGKMNARMHLRRIWTAKIRLQRAFFTQIYKKEHISKETYLLLRTKAKGGFFRSERHIKLFLTEHHLWVNHGKK